MPEIQHVVEEGSVPVENTGRRPWPLWLLAGAGLIGSVLTLALLAGVFAWLQAGTIFVADLEKRPDQDLLFGVVRNAVTAGAALGLGITLVLSYRRQKTLEENQTTTAKALLVSSLAQQTAARALDLGNRQHQLEVDRRSYDQIKDLRERYAAAAGQLGNESATVRMAGVYVMATLADEWHRQDHDDQRQACIDVLCSYYRAEPKDEDRRDLDWPVKEAIWRSFLSRLRQDNSHARWSSTMIDFRNVQQAPAQITGIRQDTSLIDFTGSNFVQGLTISQCSVESGHLKLRNVRIGDQGLVFRDVHFMGGRTTIGLNEEAGPSTVQFIDCSFDHGRLELLGMAGARVEFIKCKFNGGELDFSWIRAAAKVKFVDSVFTADVIKDADDRLSGSFNSLEAIEVVVRGCDFTGSSTPFSGHVVPSWITEHRHDRETQAEPAQTP
jgi:hypothetical protein